MALVPYTEKKARPGPRSYPEPPSDWERITKERGYDGRVDVFYREPITNKLFRSKKAVWQKLRNEIWDFDFEDVPEEVTLVLDNNSTNKWNVYEGERRVTDEEVNLWEKASIFVCNWNNFNGSTSTGTVDKKRKAEAEEQEQQQSEKPTIDVLIEFKPSN